MPFTLDIIPHVPSLDMYGSARSGTAYSLSGEIVLTLTPSSSGIFGSANAASSSTTPAFRPTSIYLASLLLTFEGRVEILSSNCGYAPFRLCSVEKELAGSAANGKPLVLTNRGQANGVMRWSMTFDLPIPGWLPPSVALDENGSGTSYTLHAQAKFAEDMETAAAAMTTTVSASGSGTPPPSRPGTPSLGSSAVSSYLPGLSVSLSALNPFSSFTRSKLRHATASPVHIKVNRFRAPKSLNPFGGAPDLTAPLVPPQIYHPTPSLFPVTLESVETRVTMPSRNKEETVQRIPIDILGGIEVVAGVPEYFGLNEEKVPLSLRVRSTNSASVNKGLVLEAFDVEVEQVEKFRSSACERFTSTYPVPPSDQQPPNKPFLLPHTMEHVYALGISPPTEAVQWTRTVPMLPTKRVNFRPSPATGGLEVDGEWAKMDLAISTLRKCDLEDKAIESGDARKEEEKVGRNMRRKLLNPDLDTPFCKVRHEMKIALKLSWLPEEAAAEINTQFGVAGNTNVTLGEQIRKARMAHKDRRVETLLMNLPIKLTQVSDGVERLFKTLGVHHGAATSLNVMSSLAPAMRRTLARSRSSSPAPSLTSSSSSRLSPPTNTLPLPISGAINIPTSAAMSRTSTPAPPAALPSSSSSVSHSLSSSCSSNGLLPYAAAVATAFPGPFVLPPYSELYHSNGDRKESLYGGWLPPYVEKEDLPPLDTEFLPSEPETEQDLGLALEA